MIALLRDLKKKVVIGFVGGSDMKKISEQLEGGAFSRSTSTRRVFNVKGAQFAMNLTMRSPRTD